MKQIITLSLLLISALGFSQKAITKDIGDFNTLKVYDLMEVNLIQSDDNKVVIKVEKTYEVLVINDNGKLKLRMETDTRFQGEDTYIEVYFKNIETIDANEGSYIVGNALISQENIELKAQEGGKIKVGLDVNHVDIKSVTGGIIEASGLSNTQNIKLNTGGIFEGRDLKTKETKIGVTAAGEAEVYATERVEVSITAGGDVIIYGNPKQIKEKKFAGGRVHVMN